MKTFIIKYSFDGYGDCVVDADTKEEAEDKFYEGTDCSWLDDTTEHYQVNSVKEDIPSVKCFKCGRVYPADEIGCCFND